MVPFSLSQMEEEGGLGWIFLQCLLGEPGQASEGETHESGAPSYDWLPLEF